MAENKKWSEKELVNSWTNAARVCILDGSPLDNKTVLLSSVLNSVIGYTPVEQAGVVADTYYNKIKVNKYGFVVSGEWLDPGGSAYTHPSFPALNLTNTIVTGVTVTNQGHVAGITSATFKELLSSELGNPADSNNTYVLSSSITGVRSWVPMTAGTTLTKVAITNLLGLNNSTYENALGNPATNGYILSSTLTGTRSWVENIPLKLGVSRSIWGNSFDGSAGITGSIVFEYDRVEKFIKGNVFGGAIRLRGNSTGATDRGIQLGRVDNTSAWLAYLTVNADTGFVGIGTDSPSALLDLYSQTNNLPATSGTLQAGARLRLGRRDGAVLDFGSVGSSGLWLQATSGADLSLKYPILINPNGGNVLINKTVDEGYGFDLIGTARIAGAFSVNGTGLFTDKTTHNQGLNAANRIQVADGNATMNTANYGTLGVTRLSTGAYDRAYFAMSKETAVIWAMGIGINNDFLLGIPNTSSNIASIYLKINPTTGNALFTGDVVAYSTGLPTSLVLPIASDTALGTVKTGASLNITAEGLINFKVPHYTTVSTSTYKVCKDITAEIPLGTGSIANSESISVTLTFLPISNSFGVVGNILANASTWAGVGMKISFVKGGTYWMAFITNDLGVSVVKDGIYLSISAKQTV